MGIELFCSEKVHHKLDDLLKAEDIQSSNTLDIALVERGYKIPEDKLVILFNAIDYMEAFEYIKLKHLSHDYIENKSISINDTDMLTGYYNNRYIIIDPKSILYISVHKTEVTCVTDNKTCFLKEPLYYYEKRLRNSSFVQVNKSQLVNLINVVEIIPWFNSRLVLVLKDDIRVEVSKKYSKILKKTLGI